MRKRCLLVIALMLAASQSYAQQNVSFEDAVMMTSDGMIVRGTVMTVRTEGKDAPMPKVEAGTPQKLRTLWKVRIDECYYASRKECADQVDSVITISAITGIAVECEGALAYGEIITNATGIAVTSMLAEGQTYLLFVRPDQTRPDAYRVLPVHNGCSRINDGVVDIELRSHDLLRSAAKSLPANVALAAKYAPETKGLKTQNVRNPQAYYYSDTVPVKDLGNLINRIRGNGQDAPNLSTTPTPEVPRRP